MKVCITCDNKSVKNGVYKAHLEEFVQKQLPKNNKLYHHKSSQKIEVKNLKPNKTIFYFATNYNDFTKKIKNRSLAYGKLENSGVTSTDENGTAIIHINCPQLYMNDNKKVYSRHFHFLYWDNKEKSWNENLYTKPILCEIKKDEIKDILSNKIVFVDARLEEEYNKKHIPNTISMPYNKRWTKDSIMEKIKTVIKDCSDKLVPILIYCNNYEDGIKLYTKLNKLGFYNTMHFIK